jgi:serine/threonine protein kinase
MQNFVNQVKILSEKYEVDTRTLGFGEFSVIKLSTDKNTKQKFAIKIFSKNVDKNSHGFNIIENEIRLLSCVNCPNVIKIYDYFLGDSQLKEEKALSCENNISYIVLEYMERGDLFDLVKRKKSFPIKIVRFFFKQLINGLNSLKKANIAHRDIKLENLVIDNEYSLKIIDFGFSCRIQDQNEKLIRYDYSLGTEGYMAPEVNRGEYFADKIDVFSTGVILFCLLFGHAPFFKATKQDKFYSLLIERDNRVYWEKILKSRTVGNDAIFLINRMLAYDPLERIDVEEIYQTEFFNGETSSVNEVQEFFST